MQKQAIQRYEQSIEKVKENEETIRRLDSSLEQTKKDKKQLENELFKAQKELLEKQNAQIVAGQKEQNIRIQVLKESGIYALFQEAAFNPKIKIGITRHIPTRFYLLKVHLPEYLLHTDSSQSPLE